MHRFEGKDGFFAELERHSVVLSPASDMGLQRDRWWLGLIVLGGLLALLPPVRITGWSWGSWLPAIGVVMQMIGLCVFSLRQARDVLPDFVDARRKFAGDMDAHFMRRKRVVEWLRSIPAGDLEERVLYVEGRLEALRSRYALLFGAVDKLGVLPVIVGAFIQFQGVMSMSFWLVLTGVGIGVFYAMALWISRFRLQMEGYSRLLGAAIATKE